MCTGRIDLSFIFRAFAKRADGVIISGCWPGDCHYVTQGNYDALSNTHIARKLLARIGVKTERLGLEWVGASEGARFAELMSDFTLRVKGLGPLGKVEGLDEATLKLRLDAVNRLVPYIKLVERERLRPPTRTQEAINAFYESDEANRLFDKLIAAELVNSQIMVLLEEGPQSTAGIAQRLGLSSSNVAKQMRSSSGRGLVTYDQSRGTFALAQVKA